MQAGSSWTRVGGRDRAELYELGLPAARTLLAYAPGVERVRTRSVTGLIARKRNRGNLRNSSVKSRWARIHSRLFYSSEGDTVKGNTVTMSGRVPLSLLRDDPDASEIPHAKFPLALTAVRRCAHHHAPSFDPKLMA